MKYLIVGRSGRGKDRLCAELQKQGLKILKSYTTRPKRTPNEDTHIFITPEEANTITDKIATTTLNGYDYFATKEQVKECDVYTIDPHGIYELVKNMPDTSFHIIYCSASDINVCREMAIKRATNPEKEATIFDKRAESEDEEFTEFEKIIQDPSASIAPNCIGIHLYENDYKEQTVVNYAKALIAQKHSFDNLIEIINQCITFGILTSSQQNHVDVAYYDREQLESTPHELFVDMLLADKEGFYGILSNWLCDTTIPSL